MDVETRLELIKGVGEEIITTSELKDVLETKTHPVAYDGFEPSGLAHLPFGVFRPLLLKDLIKAGVKFKFWLADWHAMINNKMGGDLDNIHKVGDYFIEVWRAAGVSTKGVEFIWASKKMNNEYWKKVLLIAKNCSVKRATRALTIMGRKEGELTETAQYFYPMMQTADIFQLNVDVCQLGLDQRRANMLAREVAPKLGLKKPVVVSHHMLMGLSGMKEPEGFSSESDIDREISSKMSKSKPQSCIFVHDSRSEIEKKIASAYCAPKDVTNNPVLDYAKNIVFRALGEMNIEREKRFGGSLSFGNYDELEQAFRKGELHPNDLKSGVATQIDKIVRPVRTHFEKNVRAKKLYEFVKKQEVTR
jgi:tyrosyl-tRNA synthetase